MKKLTISVTEAARNFADCVNRAHYQNITFVLLKSGSPVARLIPDSKDKVCAGRDLAEALGRIELSPSEGAWHRDLVNGRKALKTPTDKWR